MATKKCCLKRVLDAQITKYKPESIRITDTISSLLNHECMGIFFFLWYKVLKVDATTYEAFILSRNGWSRIFTCFVSLLIGHDGPVTNGQNLTSLGIGISMYSDFCISTAISISSDLLIFGNAKKLLVFRMSLVKKLFFFFT